MKSAAARRKGSVPEKEATTTTTPAVVLHFEPATVELLRQHMASLEEEIQALINVSIPQQIQLLEQAKAKCNSQSLEEKHAAVSRFHEAAVDTFETICHWISMKEERLECGNEFGSEVQAAVNSSVSNAISSLSDKKDKLHEILSDLLSIDVPKYDAVKDSEAHVTLKKALLHDHSVHVERFLDVTLLSYFKVLHVVTNNRSSLLDPKNRHGLSHAHSSEDGGSSSSHAHTSQNMLFA